MTDPPTPDELAASYLGRCRAIARNLTRRAPWERDEAESVAVAAVDEAIRSYRPKRGEFRPFADVVVGYRVRDYLAGRRPKGKGVADRKAKLPAGLPGPLPSDGAGLFSPDPPVGWEAESEDEVRAMAARLPGRLGEVVRLRYLHADAGRLGGLAARLGSGKEWAGEMHRRALAMLAAGPAAAPRPERRRRPANPARLPPSSPCAAPGCKDPLGGVRHKSGRPFRSSLARFGLPGAGCQSCCGRLTYRLKVGKDPLSPVRPHRRRTA